METINVSLVSGAFDYVALVAQLVPGVAALAIALYGLRISHRQATLQAQQTEILDRQVFVEASRLKHELFDRRFEIMIAFRDFLIAVLHGRADDDARLEFEVRTAAAPFVLDPSFADYIKEIRRTSLELDFLEEDYSPDLPQKERGENVEGRRRRHDWIGAQVKELDARFGPHLCLHA